MEGIKNEKVDVLIEFGNQVKRYMEHFNMIDIDLATSIGTTTRRVRAILVGRFRIRFIHLIKFGSVFGLEWYLFCDPDHPLPKFEDLPKSTQDLIRKREIKTLNKNTSNR